VDVIKVTVNILNPGQVPFINVDPPLCKCHVRRIIRRIDATSQAAGSSEKSLDASPTAVGVVTQVLLSTNDFDINHSVAEHLKITVPTAENLTIYSE